ncbi:MAG TPA: type II toxin-antitoxin system ParD family antitoxin [Ktedonobacteraceae bacterium]|jgi:antitoxin ParD1/3/4
MPNTEKMSITLTPELAALVNDAVAAGDYASTSEVIREALRDWRVKQMIRRQQLRDIRHLWDEAVQSGPGRFQDVEELIQEAEQRFQAEKSREGKR